MAWTATWPDGTSSVEDNEPTGVANTNYIKSTVGLDHYFDDAGGNDGLHRWMQAPKSESAGTPLDPTLSGDADGMVYVKEKTTTEQPGGVQSVLPYFKDAAATPGIMEMIGIRACGVFSATGGTITMQYSHNLNAVTPITRTSTGIYVANFATNLPTNNYMMFGGAVNSASSADSLASFFVPATGATGLLTAVKSVSACNFRVTAATGKVDPLQAWFVVFGG